jgi:hypothetical protein
VAAMTTATQTELDDPSPHRPDAIPPGQPNRRVSRKANIVTQWQVPDVMTAEVITASVDASIAEVAALLANPSYDRMVSRRGKHEGRRRRRSPLPGAPSLRWVCVGSSVTQSS